MAVKQQFQFFVDLLLGKRGITKKAAIHAAFLIFLDYLFGTVVQA
jgi:hypothetical protein